MRSSWSTLVALEACSSSSVDDPLVDLLGGVVVDRGGAAERSNGTADTATDATRPAPGARRRRRRLQRPHLVRGERPPLPRRQRAGRRAARCGSAPAADRVADRLAHAPHLAVAALVDGEAQHVRRRPATTLAGAVRPSSSSTPSRRRRSGARRRACPRPRPGTPSRRRSDGWVSRWVEVAVVGEQQQALGVGVEPARPGTPGARRARARRTVGRPWGSAAVVTTPGGLVQQVVDEARPRTDTGTPSTSTRSRSGSTRRPSTATSPLTVHPARRRSAPRRPAGCRSPARARTFCSRSPSAQASGVIGAGVGVAGGPQPCSSASTTSAPGTNSPSGGRSSSESRPSARGTAAWCRTARPGPGPGSRPTSSM